MDHVWLKEGTLIYSGELVYLGEFGDLGCEKA